MLRSTEEVVASLRDALTGVGVVLPSGDADRAAYADVVSGTPPWGGMSCGGSSSRAHVVYFGSRLNDAFDQK
ncbi:hypothetical protein ACFWFF_25440 [Streptomyces sp. NPDC060223]|uniref:hypothetical protein n=1 Tax=unclassified Streptomyces TaxID=2593676 RepID=UPI003642C9C6